MSRFDDMFDAAPGVSKAFRDGLIPATTEYVERRLEILRRDGLMPRPVTSAQQRLIEVIRQYGGELEGGAEYWPVVNDWVNDKGPAKSLALRNITRSIEILIAAGRVVLDDDGYLHLMPGGGR